MAIRRGDSPKSKKKAPEAKPGHLPPISQTVLDWAKRPGRKTSHALPRKLEVHPFVLANHPPSVFPSGTKLAQDEEINESLAWAAASIPAAYQEGLAFLGYPELALMAQRPEYRRISEIFATEMTRKWIKFKAVSTDDDEDDGGAADGKADKTERISELENRFKELDVQGVFRKLAEYDGFMGRSHLYIDTGDTDNPDELTTPIGNGRNDLSKAKMQKRRGKKDGKLRAFRPIEAVWCYPSNYNSVDPLKADWYVPKEWYVMGKRLHASRLLTFIGREVPDLLKPAYSFGGLPLTQMAKPYVDNWLRTRQSVSDLIASFSVFVLKTDLGTILSDGSDELIRRAQLFNDLRDNHGLMILNNATEDFINVAASLGSLDHLQAQSQEQICVTGDTLIETARGQVPITLVTVDDLVMTRLGFAPIKWVGQTGHATEVVEIETAHSVLRTTRCHPIYLPESCEFVPAESVRPTDRLLHSITGLDSLDPPLRGADVGGFGCRAGTSAITGLADFCIGLCGKPIAALSRMASMFTTSTTIPATIGCPTSNSFFTPSTCAATHLHGLASQFLPRPLSRTVRSAIKSILRFGPKERTFVATSVKAKRGFDDTRKSVGTVRANVWPKTALFVTKCSSWYGRLADFIVAKSVPGVRGVCLPGHAVVLNTRQVQTNEPVYNITVADGYLPEFFANGVLTHNCSVSGIPLLKYTGIAPTGLNASTDGEMRSFYDNVHAHQEKFYTKNLTKVMHFVMLDLWGEVDEDIVFDYEPLWSLDEVALASKRKTEQETDSGYIADGVISPKESRKRIASDPTTPYQGLDVDDMPEPPDEGMESMMPGAEGATEPGGEETPTAQPEGSAPAKPTKPSHSAGAAPVASPKVASASVTKSKVSNAKVPAGAE